MNLFRLTLVRSHVPARLISYSWSARDLPRRSVSGWARAIRWSDACSNACGPHVHEIAQGDRCATMDRADESTVSGVDAQLGPDWSLRPWRQTCSNGPTAAWHHPHRHFTVSGSLRLVGRHGSHRT